MAKRSGVAVSALHFYESKGLITSIRNSGNQRRYKRDVLRYVAIIKIAQRIGIPGSGCGIGGSLGSCGFGGGIRSGADVFKALALGADAVLIARPFVTAVYGGAQEGVQAYVDKLQAELADTMAMCGAHSLADIDRSMLFGF